MKKYKGIIFDLDGTLLDTIQDLADSVNFVLLTLNYPKHTYEEYKLKIGKGFKNLIEVSLPENCRKEEIINHALHMFLGIYDKMYMNKTKPYEGISDMLEQIQKKEVKIGVNSNKRTDYSNILIQKNFPNIDFTQIYGERSGVPKKPDPSAALEIAKQMGYKPEEILYIGDSKTDMQTGENAGMDTVGVLWGFRDKAELVQFRATYIAENPEQIVNLFGK